jgi:hypothetical protein
MFGYVEDEGSFSMLNLMKRKFKNWLIAHLDVCSTLENFPYDQTIKEWKVAQS